VVPFLVSRQEHRGKKIKGFHFHAPIFMPVSY